MTKGNDVAWRVEGMNCNGCASSIHKYLSKKGFDNIHVNFSTAEVQFRTDNLHPDQLEEIRKGIHQLGFQVMDEQEDLDEPSPKSWWNLSTKLWIASIFTFPLFIYHFVMLAGIHWSILNNPWVQFGLAVPVYIIGVLHFGRSAYFALRHGNLHMDVLIFMGSTAAFVYSIIGLIYAESNYIFFETSATIITLVLLGNWIEHRAVQSTTSSIKDLVALKVQQVKKIVGRQILDVPIKAVKVGDIIQINTGDQVPTDAEIVSGTVYLDESMLTGESEPIFKQAKGKITGGTLVLEGNCRAKVTATGRDTVLEQIIELVKNAQQDKPSIQRIADQASAVFIPVVITLAFLAVGLGYWILGFTLPQAVMNGVAVLVISCPCAMGLATPTAVIVGVGRMAKNGILIKGGQTVETFSKTKHFVFDKTGTLTEPAQGAIHFDYYNDEVKESQAIIYAMENHSSHPVAQRIRKELHVNAQDLDLPDLIVDEIKGKGVMAVDTRGNQYFLGRQTVNWEDQHQNGVFLTKNRQPLAQIVLDEVIRPGAKSTIAHINNNEGSVYLLSGDSKEKTQKVAEQLGLTNFFGEQSPQDKLKKVTELTNKDITAMIGDGINDSPALAKATVGVSLGDASHIAIQSAQVVLLRGKLDQLVKALTLSKETVLTIKQNLFWAFAYNVVAIPMAMLGFLNPMFAALFMALSDAVVIGNSIRLKYKRIPYATNRSVESKEDLKN